VTADRQAHAAELERLQAAADRERQILDRRATEIVGARDGAEARADRAEQAADEARAETSRIREENDQLRAAARERRRAV
jgi:hypothetical protein